MKDLFIAPHSFFIALSLLEFLLHRCGSLKDCQRAAEAVAARISDFYSVIKSKSIGFLWGTLCFGCTPSSGEEPWMGFE